MRGAEARVVAEAAKETADASGVVRGGESATAVDWRVPAVGVEVVVGLSAMDARGSRHVWRVAESGGGGGGGHRVAEGVCSELSKPLSGDSVMAGREGGDGEKEATRQKLCLKSSRDLTVEIQYYLCGANGAGVSPVSVSVYSVCVVHQIRSCSCSVSYHVIVCHRVSE